MLYPLYLGFAFAFCAIISAAPAVLSQVQYPDNFCNVVTIYVTASTYHVVPNIETYATPAHNLVETQSYNGEISVEKTTTITKTETGFETITITANISGASGSATHFAAPTDVRFLHDGIAPLGTEISIVPVTLSTSDFSSSAVPTEVQLHSSGEDITVVQETVMVYPLKSPLPDTEMEKPTITLSQTGTSLFPFHTVTSFPEAQNPRSASLYSMDSSEGEPTRTVDVKTDVTVPSASLYSTSLTSYLVISGPLPYTVSPMVVTTLISNTGLNQPDQVLTANSVSALPVSMTTISSVTLTASVKTVESPHITAAEPSAQYTISPVVLNTTINIDISGFSYPTLSYFHSTNIPEPVETDSAKLTSTSLGVSPTIAPLIPPTEPMECGEQGIFSLNFDDVPPLAGPVDSGDVQPEPIFSPYHHFYFSEGFVVAPPPRGLYTPSSKPLFLEFLTESNVNVTRNHNIPETGKYGATGEIGNGENLHWGCYTFDAVAASVGCDSEGPTCDWQFTGVVYDPATNDSTEVVTQRVSTASCLTLNDCSLMDIAFLDNFRNLHSVRINVTVAGIPTVWWMDDLKLAWSDGRCDAGLCRASHR